MKHHVFHPEAEAEYLESVRYYAGVDPVLTGRFFEEMESLILDIRRQPERFRQFDPPSRRHFSNVFPYAVIYLDEPDRIWIVAVMHMKRLPGYWHERVD